MIFHLTPICTTLRCDWRLDRLYNPVEPEPQPGAAIHFKISAVELKGCGNLALFHPYNSSPTIPVDDRRVPWAVEFDMAEYFAEPVLHLNDGVAPRFSCQLSMRSKRFQ